MATLVYALEYKIVEGALALASASFVLETVVRISSTPPNQIPVKDEFFTRFTFADQSTIDISGDYGYVLTVITGSAAIDGKTVQVIDLV
jgi:hypothetical protein